MAIDLARTPVGLGPIAHAGRSVVVVVAYLGGLARLAGSAAWALVRPPIGAPSLIRALSQQGQWLFGAGLPLVALVHVALGSFLSMQAYYGAVFAEGTGPIVGVGLCRNLAPIMGGLVLAALLAARAVPELSRPRPLILDADPAWVPDRGGATGLADRDAFPTDPGRLAAVRIVAGMIAGPILGLWGGLVGIAVGCLIAKNLIYIAPPIFFGKMLEMLWARDAVGMLFKGMAFGGVSALFACFEGLRATTRPRSVPTAGARATVLSALSILFLNSVWYLLFYMSGNPFGPTVLSPPAP